MKFDPLSPTFWERKVLTALVLLCAFTVLLLVVKPFGDKPLNDVPRAIPSSK